MSDVTEWRWADPSGQQRLIRADELRAALAAGVVAPNTPVWRPGWREWRPAQEVAELTTSALAAANGIIQNIPPPPLAVVAMQAAFEGPPAARAPGGEEPPPPPRYVPVATRPHVIHTPSQPMRASNPAAAHASPSSSHRVSEVPMAAPSQTAVNPPVITHVSDDANTAVNLRSMKDTDADRALQPNGSARESDPPTVRPAVEAPHAPPPPAAHAAPAPAAHAPPAPAPHKPPPPVSAHSSHAPPPPPPPPSSRPKGLAALVRSPAQKLSSRPPPPRKTSRPPPPRSVPPKPKPPTEADAIEELSGSILLPDGSGPAARIDAIEELTGSVLLTDASGAIPAKAVAEEAARIAAEQAPPKPAAVHAVAHGQHTLFGQPPPPAQPQPAPAKPPPAAEELSGSFLLDAGSTGALPSLDDSDSALRAAPPARAPFAAEDSYSHESRNTPVAAEPPIAPLAMPLGPASVPPPNPPNASELAPVTRLQFAPVGVPPQAADAAPAPVATSLAASGESHALPTLVGVPPPPDLIPSSPDDSIKPAPSPDVAPFQRPPASKTSFTPPPQSARSLPSEPPVSSAPLPPPPPERSTARLHDFRSFTPDQRMKYVIPGVAALGVLVFMGVIGLIIGALRKKPSDEPVPAPSALVTTKAPTASSTAAPAPAPTVTAAPSRPAVVAAPCSLAGSAHVIAPRAVVQGGVEAQAVAGRLALGFAVAPRTGVAVALDPASLATTQMVRARASDAIRRVVPVPAPRGIAAATDSDRGGDALAGRRTVSSDPPFDLGFASGGVAWTPLKSSEADILWTLDGDAPVEAIRAAPLDPANKDAGWAVAFRRGASIFAGTTSGGATLVAKGPLLKVDGMGQQVGSPAIAAQDGVILVAWADRALAGNPWQLRFMRFAAGDASADAKPFTPSEGGLGEQAMSPAIVAAGQGRFVMAWTEGPVSNHQVRAQTISGLGVSVGAPIPISEAGVNAGQAQLAVLPDGHGVVAYLAATGDGPKAPYEVLATPIACP